MLHSTPEILVTFLNLGYKSSTRTSYGRQVFNMSSGKLYTADSTETWWRRIIFLVHRETSEIRVELHLLVLSMLMVDHVIIIEEGSNKHATD